MDNLMVAKSTAAVVFMTLATFSNYAFYTLKKQVHKFLDKIQQELKAQEVYPLFPGFCMNVFLPGQ